MSKNKRPRNRDPLILPRLPNDLITDSGYIANPEEQVCPSSHPDCPNIRCKRSFHDGIGLCHNVGRNPYRASYWEFNEVPRTDQGDEVTES